MKKFIFASSVAIGAWCTFFACSANHEGAVFLAVQTDLAVAQDLDAIGIGVSVGGVVKFSNLYGLGASPLQPLPATLAIVEPQAQGTPVTIRVIGFHGATPLTIRDVITTIPHDQIVSLTVPIQFLSLSDTVTGSLTTDEVNGEKNPITSSSTSIHLDDNSTSPFDAFTDFTSPCSVQGNTMIDGTCVDPHLDPSAFLPYDPSVSERKQCFDMQTCCGHATSTALVKTATSCTFTATGDTSKINVAMRTGGRGFCISTGCLIPLDQDPIHGFSVDAQNVVHLPLGVCTSPNVVDVMADYSGSCTSKPTTEQIDGAGALCLDDDATDGGSSDAPVATDGNTSDANSRDGSLGGNLWYNDTGLVTFKRDPTSSYLVAVSSTTAGSANIFFVNTLATTITAVSSTPLTGAKNVQRGSLALDGTNYSFVTFPATTTAFAGTYVTEPTTINGPFSVTSGSPLTGNLGYGTYMYYTTTSPGTLFFTPSVTADATTTFAAAIGGSAQAYSLTLASSATNFLYGAVYEPGTDTSLFVQYPSDPTTSGTTPFTQLGSTTGQARSSIVMTDKGGTTHLVSLLSATDNKSGVIYDLNLASNNGTVVATPNVGNDPATEQPFNLTAGDGDGYVYYASRDGTIYEVTISSAASDGTPTALVAAGSGATTVAYYNDLLYYAVPGAGIGKVKAP